MELFSPEIVFFENKELLIHFRVYRKITTIAQTEGEITKEGALYTGQTHCVKSVQFRSFSGPYFTVFSLNAGKYGPGKLRIRTLFVQ